jgi:hypothetical protein
MKICHAIVRKSEGGFLSERSLMLADNYSHWALKGAGYRRCEE